MRISRRKYSIITNTCLYSAVGSAVGFDHSEHVGWIVLAAVASLISITTYFVQHWETKPHKARNQLAGTPTSLVMAQAQDQAWRYALSVSSRDLCGNGQVYAWPRSATRALAERSTPSAGNHRSMALAAALQRRAQQRDVSPLVLLQKFVS